MGRRRAAGGALGVAGAQLKPLTRLVQELQAADAAAARLSGVLAEESDARHHSAGRLPALARHAQSIVFEEVRFRYPGADHDALAGIDEPERKRKIIGETFIEVFEREAKKIEGAHFLAQGTLYPDVIESVSAS
mgnify:CR=1 FL=1